MRSLLLSFAQNLSFSETQLEEILSQPLTEVLNSPELQQELNSLDTNLLKETLPTAGGVLAKELPPFYNWLKNELGVKRVPDSPDHTTTWVIGFVHNQESLAHLVELHRPVPRPALEASIPRLIGMFEGVEDAQVRQEWQKAIAALCLVLVVAAREQDRVAVAV
ncbi:hypothetical protein CDG76_01735 [Nostoc sp. 'Peltigera membranacea cyanobiont' 210A]|uniref:hypothetical protein n=1 Tax=Nostoc sp. 'Peltigera membranacea cyanobiont' 210A TaxID=2014529 RepID=UPI000B95319D|nr:hypothetical protein [Nostoc sp. 'Peltigera membranacea cyanobiont' 210A]OYD97625.1 hypothetical protein CDG76_01735 [Nostoc sp. 'Peltigera membranacea cyanobiont' 210A]